MTFFPLGSHVVESAHPYEAKAGIIEGDEREEKTSSTSECGVPLCSQLTSKRPFCLCRYTNFEQTTGFSVLFRLSGVGEGTKPTKLPGIPMDQRGVYQRCCCTDGEFLREELHV